MMMMMMMMEDEDEDEKDEDPYGRQMPAFFLESHFCIVQLHRDIEKSPASMLARIHSRSLSGLAWTPTCFLGRVGCQMLRKSKHGSLMQIYANHMIPGSSKKLANDTGDRVRTRLRSSTPCNLATNGIDIPSMYRIGDTSHTSSHWQEPLYNSYHVVLERRLPWQLPFHLLVNPAPHRFTVLPAQFGDDSLTHPW